jgi:para-nitrobenzyl esterase
MAKRSGILFTVLFAFLFIGLTASCSNESIEVNVSIDPIIIDAGYISGTMIGEVGKEVRIYRGIPYAAPPVGKLRWKPPQPAESWNGILECTVYGNASPQNTEENILFVGPLSENCLYLNVLTPAKKASEKLPVMVWMHGGAYKEDSGSLELYNLTPLPQNGIVLVTVNMRLGPIGLLAHPLLSKESPDDISGNYMFFDMIAALQWVQRNIAVFGGNPENVTIFGQSGGAAKVGILMASPLTKGLYHKAIIQSGGIGGPFAGRPMEDLESMGERFFAKLGVEMESNPLEAARNLPWEKIIEIETSLSKELNMEDYGLWDSCIDGHFLSDTPVKIFETGKQVPVPLITCTNLGELTGPGVLVVPEMILGYLNMLNGTNKAGQMGYASIFDQVPSKWKEEGCVSFHALELGYVFGDLNNISGFWTNVSFLALSSGAKNPEPGLTDIDRKIANNMMAMWTQFARTGNPSVDGLVNWPAYDSETDQYLYIGESLEVRSGFSKIAQER